jgi:cytochrome P450
MLHDPTTYQDPEEFRPERFLREVNGRIELDTDVLNPRELAFGRGRR